MLMTGESSGKLITQVYLETAIKTVFVGVWKQYIYLQCFDAVGWVTGRASGP